MHKILFTRKNICEKLLSFNIYIFSIDFKDLVDDDKDFARVSTYLKFDFNQVYI